MCLEYEEITDRIIGAAIEVHRRLGPGFLETIYENALLLELKKRGCVIERQREVTIFYDGMEIGRHRLDLFVDRTIIVELKAIKSIDTVHFAIVKSYLRACGKQHALILNFNREKLEIKRVISS